MYFEEQTDHGVTLISASGERLWQFTSLAEALKTCHDFLCLGNLPVVEHCETTCQQQA
jgi:hypothetical protein